MVSPPPPTAPPDGVYHTIAEKTEKNQRHLKRKSWHAGDPVPSTPSSRTSSIDAAPPRKKANNRFLSQKLPLKAKSWEAKATQLERPEDGEWTSGLWVETRPPRAPTAPRLAPRWAVDEGSGGGIGEVEGGLQHGEPFATNGNPAAFSPPTPTPRPLTPTALALLYEVGDPESAHSTPPISFPIPPTSSHPDPSSLPSNSPRWPTPRFVVSSNRWIDDLVPDTFPLAPGDATESQPGRQNMAEERDEQERDEEEMQEEMQEEEEEEEEDELDDSDDNQNLPSSPLKNSNIIQTYSRRLKRVYNIPQREVPPFSQPSQPQGAEQCEDGGEASEKEGDEDPDWTDGVEDHTLLEAVEAWEGKIVPLTNAFSPQKYALKEGSSAVRSPRRVHLRSPEGSNHPRLLFTNDSLDLGLGHARNHPRLTRPKPRPSPQKMGTSRPLQKVSVENLRQQHQDGRHKIPLDPRLLKSSMLRPPVRSPQRPPPASTPTSAATEQQAMEGTAAVASFSSACTPTPTRRTRKAPGIRFTTDEPRPSASTLLVANEAATSGPSSSHSAPSSVPITPRLPQGAPASPIDPKIPDQHVQLRARNRTHPPLQLRGPTPQTPRRHVYGTSVTLDDSGRTGDAETGPPQPAASLDQTDLDNMENLPLPTIPRPPPRQLSSSRTPLADITPAQDSNEGPALEISDSMTGIDMTQHLLNLAHAPSDAPRNAAREQRLEERRQRLKAKGKRAATQPLAVDAFPVNEPRTPRSPPPLSARSPRTPSRPPKHTAKPLKSSSPPAKSTPTPTRANEKDSGTGTQPAHRPQEQQAPHLG